HLHRLGTRPVRRPVLQLPARAHAEASASRASRLAQGRIPELTRSSYELDVGASRSPRAAGFGELCHEPRERIAGGGQVLLPVRSPGALAHACCAAWICASAFAPA